MSDDDRGRLTTLDGRAARLPASDDGREVHYYFPVEIVVVGGLNTEDRRSITDAVWERLADSLDQWA